MHIAISQNCSLFLFFSQLMKTPSPSSMEDSSDTLVRVRKEYMVSPNGGNPTYRTAHFLPHCVSSSIDEHLHHKIPSSSSFSSSFEPQNCRLKLSFLGWKSKLENWKSWVDHMITFHLPTWKKSGIFEAILGSTYKIRRDNNDLVLEIAEKWCSETQSFIFPWGEATVTLEDMMVLGGFCVLGDSVLQCIEQVELKDIEEKLHKARLELNRTKSRKPSLSDWKKKFMNSGSELEHEAFLAYWLSTFVFPFNDTVREQVFPLAIKLARGSRIALAPAVLASIYRDLSLLKEKICASSTCENENDVRVLNLTIRSPFHLVQTWVWERFSGLRPQPNLLKNGEPRLARWGNLEFMKKIENVRLALDSSEQVFQWRPYGNNAIRNWDLPKFYTDNEVLLPDGPGSDEDFMSFARCLRVSELVGLDSVQQYLPHRVSMQFGMDQDIPNYVNRFNETPSIAWNHYNMNISNVDFYVPSRLFQADVSVRYLKWWKQSVLVQKEPRKLTGPQNRVSESSKRPKKDIEGKGKHKNSKLKEAGHFVEHFKCTKQGSLKRKKEGEKYCDMGFSSKSSKGSLKNSQERPNGKDGGEKSHVPPSIPSNRAEEEARDFTKEAGLSIAQIVDPITNNKNGPFGSLSSSTSNNLEDRNMGTKKRSLEVEDILKTKAAMKESKTQKFLENERLGEKEKQSLMSYLEGVISKHEREVADIKAKFF